MKLRIYCDGACSGNPGPGGWAAILLFPTGRQEISGNETLTTNNKMELKAAIESLKLGLKLGYKKIDVYSDSAYVVNAIKNKWWKKWIISNWKSSKHESIKNRELWEEIIGLFEKYSNSEINFIKIKGHVGNIHNEHVDELAKMERDIAHCRAYFGSSQ